LAEVSYEKPIPPGIHVILGGSAAGIFNRVFHPRGKLLIEEDILNCGPTPPRIDSKAWSALRHDYWQKLAPEGIDQYAYSPQRVVLEIDKLRGAEQLTIWAATGLSEQLFIASTLEIAREAGVDPARISIVQFESVANHGIVTGMGELGEKYMSDHPEPVAVTSEMLRDYHDTWSALTSPDPALIESFAETHASASPWLKRAMRLLLRRFPDKQSGLPFWDLALLREARRHSPNTRRIIGNAMVNHWDDGDLVGDYYLFGRILRLGNPALPQPLLELSGSTSDMRETEVKLTPFGTEVLEARASNYPANPIEDWASGVKLSSASGVLWFREGDRLVRG
jgi:hypothetical protein